MSTPATLATLDPKAHMRSVIGRVATGPEYSKNISAVETRDAIRAILNNQADPVQAGIFLIALRMKRETDDENIGTRRIRFTMFGATCRLKTRRIVNIAANCDARRNFGGKRGKIDVAFEQSRFCFGNSWNKRRLQFGASIG